MDFLFTAARFIGILFLVIVVFNLMILVHEWGHFLAARWRGLKVEKFYIWFGKPIWKKVINGVEYGLGSIPFGGFVALPQMAPMDALEGGSEFKEELPPISGLDKIIVAFAGPLFSFGLACFFAMVLWSVGGYPDRRLHTTTLGYVDKTAPAWEAGLRPGDKILAVDGTPVDVWDGPIDSVTERIAFGTDDKIEFTIQRPGVAEPLKIRSGFKIEPGTFTERKGLRTVGIMGGGEVRVEKTLPNSPGEVAGLKPKDVVVSFNGQAVYSAGPILDAIKESPDAALNLVIKRDGKTENITVKPAKPAKPADHAPAIGVVFETHVNDVADVLLRPTPGKLVGDAATIMVRTVKGLVTPGSNISFQHLSGPLRIGSIYYRLFEMPNGWRLVLWFSVLLNVNLAILNLLPFPVLDGGHIVMALMGLIRRKPVLHVKVLEFIQTGCALLLIGFMLYVTWFDSIDIFGSKAKEAAQQTMEFAPPAK